MGRNGLNLIRVFWPLWIEIKHFVQAIWFLLNILRILLSLIAIPVRFAKNRFALFSWWHFMHISRYFLNELIRNQLWAAMAWILCMYSDLFLIEIKLFLQAIWFLLKHLPISTQFDYYSCRICEKHICLVLMVTFHAY